MSNHEVLVYKIEEPVIDHPDADRLSLVQIQGYTCISAKLEDGSHRYKQGDLVVYIPEQSVLPEWMMKEMDFWDVNKNKPAFRYVKPKRLRGIYSQGILYPVITGREMGWDEDTYWIDNINNGFYQVYMGDDVAEYLEITKWEPPVPAQMAGQITGEYAKWTIGYDFDSIQKNPRLFDEDEDVIVTEKIHGTLVQIGYIPELSDPHLFGSMGNIFVTSKGIGKRGFILKNLPDNEENLYVRMLKKYLNDYAFETRIRSLSYGIATDEYRQVHIFGEIFGEGVQDLGYGQKTPLLRLFDVAVDRKYLDFYKFLTAAGTLGIPTVPWLYEGPFDLKHIEQYRDGKDTISESHIREGIVIKSKYEASHPRYGRKIAKWISPEYSLRKNGTEFV